MYVPLSAIAADPLLWCVRGRDYFVLNPDVVEDEASEEQLERWGLILKRLLMLTFALHAFVWRYVSFRASLLVPTVSLGRRSR